MTLAGTCDERLTPPPRQFNRWLAVPGSIFSTASVGSVYAFSQFNDSLSKQLGVVAQASGDWALPEVTMMFSLCAASLGVTTFTLGKWAEKAGPRKVAATAAVGWGSGLALTAVGAATHTLPLCYLGYGALG